MTTPPTLAARRVGNGLQLEVECPGCGRSHLHDRFHTRKTGCSATEHNNRPCTCPLGVGDGRRTAPCQTRYILKEIP